MIGARGTHAASTCWHILLSTNRNCRGRQGRMPLFQATGDEALSLAISREGFPIR